MTASQRLIVKVKSLHRKSVQLPHGFLWQIMVFVVDISIKTTTVQDKNFYQMCQLLTGHEHPADKGPWTKMSCTVVDVFMLCHSKNINKDVYLNINSTTSYYINPFMCRLHPKHFETQSINITVANILCTHLTSTTWHASKMAQDIEIVQKYIVVSFLPSLVAFWDSIST